MVVSERGALFEVGQVLLQQLWVVIGNDNIGGKCRTCMCVFFFDPRNTENCDSFLCMYATELRSFSPSVPFQATCLENDQCRSRRSS